MNNLCSIIMPVYNSMSYLRKAIDSVLNQTYSEFELILIDDGSFDDSGTICDEYARRDNRIFVVHKKNGGICSARNKGLELARGEYIIFIDNDDEISCDLLEANINMLKKYDCDWVKFGRRDIVIKDEKQIESKEQELRFRIYEKEDIFNSIFELRYNGLLTYVWDSIFKRDILIKNKILFDTYFRYGNEDIDFCHNYIIHTNKLIINPTIYYNHYGRIGVSTSSKFYTDKIKANIYLENKLFDNCYKNLEFSNLNCRLYNLILDKYLISNTCWELNKFKSNFKFKKNQLLLLKEFNQKRFLFNVKKRHIKKNKQIIKLDFFNFLYKVRMYRILLLCDKIIVRLGRKCR